MAPVVQEVPETRTRPELRFKVLAVSSSRPRIHTMYGDEVSSAIARKAYPASKPLVLTVDGIEGNQPASHNAHVYALFAHHYDSWTSRLGVDRSAWNWCHWGENLTLEVTPEVNEDALLLGDIWEFGDGDEAVQLQVTGSRVPCSRLSWRCGQPESWLRDLAADATCGLYLTVLKGGKVRAGDVGRFVQARNGGEPVATITRMAYSTEYSPQNKATIKRILDQDILQGMNRVTLSKKLDLIREKEMRSKQGWKGWRELEIFRVEQENADVKSFYLRSQDGKNLPAFAAGQFLTVKLPMPSPTVRCWTLSQWTPNEHTQEYRLSIKRAGVASNFLFREAGIGLESLRLQARAPAGIFVVERESIYPIRQIYVSAGIGITPIVAMLQAHIQDSILRKTPAVCVHVTQNSSTLLFSDFLRSLPEIVQMIIFFTHPLPTDIQGEHYTHRQRPTASFWKSFMASDYTLNLIGVADVPTPGKHSEVYMCGPEPFEEETRHTLLDCGVHQVSIKSENFAGASAADEYGAPHGLETATVRFKTSGKDLTWSSNQNVSILELAEEAGLDLPKGCEAGICGSCEVKVCKGMVTGGPEKQARARICLAKPATALVEIEA